MASIQKVDTGYRVRVYYYDENGVRRTISKNTKKLSDAKAIARQIEWDIENKLPETVIPTLHEYTEEYIRTYRENVVSASSLDLDKYCMGKFFELIETTTDKQGKKKRIKRDMYDKEIRLNEITGTMHQKYINQMFEYDYSMSTIKKVNSLMFRVMERARYDGFISFNPAEMIKYRVDDKAKKAEYIPRDKIKPFLGRVKKRNIYHYYLFRLILETGLRVGEACALTYQDINRDDNSIQVTKSYDQKRDKLGPTKNKHHRTVYISKNLSVELFKLLQIHNANKITMGEDYHNQYNFIFVDAFGKPISRSSVHNTMMYCSEKVLGPKNKMSVHKLRHTHATLLLESNIPMKVIQERLGHQSMEMTEKVYAHVTPSLKKEAQTIYENAIKDVF